MYSVVIVGPAILPVCTSISDVAEGLAYDHLFLSSIGELIVTPVDKLVLAGIKSCSILNNELSKNCIKRIKLL